MKALDKVFDTSNYRHVVINFISLKQKENFLYEEKERKQTKEEDGIKVTIITRRKSNKNLS